MNGLSLEHDLYSDYLVVNQGKATATRLAALLEDHLSHDAITRSLNQADYGSAQLWQVVKPFVAQIAHPQAVLNLDDTIEEKAYMQINDLIAYHYDHTKGRSVKGLNQLTALYHSQGVSLPVGYHLVKKTKTVQGKKGTKRVSEQTKQQLFRDLIRQALANNLPFEYVLADSWYGSVENINYVIAKTKKFIFALKSNRHVALSETDQQQGRHQPMSQLNWEETNTYRVWLAGVETALVLTRLVFDHKDHPPGELYLITNELGADAAHLQQTYALRWKVRGRPCGRVLQVDQIQHGLCRFTCSPGSYPEHSFVSIHGGLRQVGSGQSADSTKPFCLESETNSKCLKTLMAAMAGL